MPNTIFPIKVCSWCSTHNASIKTLSCGGSTLSFPRSCKQALGTWHRHVISQHHKTLLGESGIDSRVFDSCSWLKDSIHVHRQDLNSVVLKWSPCQVHSLQLVASPDRIENHGANFHLGCFTKKCYHKSPKIHRFPIYLPKFSGFVGAFCGESRLLTWLTHVKTCCYFMASLIHLFLLLRSWWRRILHAG